jgi:hypothetical protein
MRNRFCIGIVGEVTVLLAGSAAGAEKSEQKADQSDRQGHIEKHKKMSEAHRRAAECLESGKSEKDCNAQLKTDCRGLASGPHCGMRH